MRYDDATNMHGRGGYTNFGREYSIENFSRKISTRIEEHNTMYGR